MPGSVENLNTALNQSPVQSVISFPSAPGPHSMFFVFTEYSYNAARAGEQSVLGSYDSGTYQTGNITGVQLPIPANLTDNDNLMIENITQSALESFLGGRIADAASGLQNSNLTLRDVPQALQEFGASLNLGDIYSQGVSSLSNAVQGVLNASVGNVSRDIMYLLRSSIPAGISQAADRALGSTVNPRASLAFEGVNLKQHSYSWQLAPRNKEESDRIRDIIRIIKQNSLPTYQTLSTGGFKAYLRYPSIVDTYLLGVNPAYFLQFKSSMVRSVSVEYGAGGLVSIVKGGKPANINLTIELVELDIHTAEDYGVTGSTVVDGSTPAPTSSGSSSGPAGGPIPE